MDRATGANERAFSQNLLIGEGKILDQVKWLQYVNDPLIALELLSLLTFPFRNLWRYEKFEQVNKFYMEITTPNKTQTLSLIIGIACGQK